MSETAYTERSVLQLVECLPHLDEADLQPNLGAGGPTSLSTNLEVDFALALSRMIDDARNDPAKLRTIVYQLAREKLRDQISGEGAQRGATMARAFDVAVQRVEAFAHNDNRQTPQLPQTTPEQTRALRSVAEQLSVIAPSLSMPQFERAPARSSNPRRANVSFAAGRQRDNTLLVRFLVVLAVILGALAATSFYQARQEHQARRDPQQGNMGSWTNAGPERPSDPPPSKMPPQVRRAAVAPEVPLPSTTQQPAAASNSPTPAGFGVFAMSGKSLFKLEVSPLPMPDLTAKFVVRARTSPPQKLPAGAIKFMVHRAAADALPITTAEVRVVARVARETSFDRNGRPVTTFPENSWVLRNVAYPYRAQPMQDNEGMSELRSEDPDLILVPGRYTLIVNDATYDFVVDGNVSNSAHCVERLTLPTGALHSQCGEALFVQ